MNFLFTSGHPAQVHNFRLVYQELKSHGHSVFWLTTNKDIAVDLLNIYKISFGLFYKPKKNLLSQLFALCKNTCYAISFIKRNKIDIAVSRTDPYISLACFVLRRTHIILDDTEHASKSIRQKPFIKMASCVLTAESFYLNVSPHQIRFAGNIELFYCHPNRFKVQEPWVLLQIPTDTRYAIVRFVKWDAYHDKGLIGGFTLEQKRKLVNQLSQYLRVFISSEGALPDDLIRYRINIPLDRMHDVEACASLLIGESATMASEATILGTPAIYLDEVGRGYTDEEAREQLLYMFSPRNNGAETAITKAMEVVSPSFDILSWKQRHHKWLQKKIDATAFFTWFLENYPESFKIMKENPDYQYRFK